jgi:DNA-binding protein H-NS
MSNQRLIEIKNLREALAKEEREILAQERAAGLSQAKALIKQFGFTSPDLGLRAMPTATKQKSEPKYANPANPAQTWVGIGIKPKWVKAHLEAGKDLKDLLIRK